MKKQIPEQEIPECNDFDFAADQKLWDLLEERSPGPEPSPFFSRNVLREIRIEEEQSSPGTSFWKNLLHPSRLVVSGLTALAVVSLILTNPFADSPSKPSLADQSGSETTWSEEAPTLESNLEAELLLLAANSPDLFSDEEVIAMLF